MRKANRCPFRSTQKSYLEKFEDVKPDVKVCELRIKDLKVHVLDVLRDQAGYLGTGIPNDVQQRDDVGATSQVLEDLDLSLDLLLLHWLQHLDDTWLVVLDVDAFEDLAQETECEYQNARNGGCPWAQTYFRVLPPAHFPNDLVVVLCTPLNLQVI